jgi:hypothetical protein
MPDEPAQMVPYERDAWHALQRRVERRLSRNARRLPGAARVGDATRALASRARSLPGASTVLSAVQAAMSGLSDLSGRAARASVRRGAVLEAYRKAGAKVERLEDIRNLDLQLIDDVKPRLDIRYATAVALQGAVAAAAITGVDLLVAGESVVTAGVGAAPGAGVVLTAVAADSLGVLIASQRAISHVASYYGYDTSHSDEQLISLGVLGLGVASASGKRAAYKELNQVVQGLARRQTWSQLNENVITQIVQKAFSSFGFDLTKRRLAEAVPVVGIAVASGLNARTLLSVVSEADNFYRARLLSDRYGVSLGVAAAADAGESVGGLVEIIEAEIVEDEEDDKDDDQTPT